MSISSIDNIDDAADNYSQYQTGITKEKKAYSILFILSFYFS